MENLDQEKVNHVQQKEAHPLMHGNPYPLAPAPPGFAVTDRTPCPVTTQPTNGWMNRPQTPVNCPTGLEYLTMIDQLIVVQTVDLLEVVSGYDHENRYYVTNSLGHKVYYAKEESSHCGRYCCGARRPFEMKVYNNFGQQVLNLIRPLACQSCWCFCCLQTMEVTVPPGNLVGTLEQEWNLLFPTFTIKTPNGEVVLRIKGPCCTWKCCSDINFRVYSADGNTEVGKISKKWSDYATQQVANSDIFGLSFPMDLDVKMKAVMLGACFLIDMMYFKRTPDAKALPAR